MSDNDPMTTAEAAEVADKLCGELGGAMRTKGETALFVLAAYYRATDPAAGGDLAALVEWLPARLAEGVDYEPSEDGCQYCGAGPDVPCREPSCPSWPYAQNDERWHQLADAVTRALAAAPASEAATEGGEAECPTCHADVEVEEPGVLGPHPGDYGGTCHGSGIDADVARELAARPHPATPREQGTAEAVTESDRPTWMRDERAEIERYGLTACLVAACNPDAYSHPRDVERSTPDDAPWSEVDGLVIAHDRWRDEQLAEALGIDVGRYADEELPLGDRVAELLEVEAAHQVAELAATPQAEASVLDRDGHALKWLRDLAARLGAFKPGDLDGRTGHELGAGCWRAMDEWESFSPALRDVEATLALVDDIDWSSEEPRAFVISDGDRRTSYDRDNFARLLLGMPMRELPPEPALAVGDVVETAADLDRLPVGAVVRDATTDIAQRADASWHVVGLAGDFGPNIVDLPARVLDLPTGSP